MNIKLISLHMENFKGFKDKSITFGQHTKIKGMNGLGKSTIACAWMWLFFGYSYDLTSNPKVRREVDGVASDGEVSVTATIDIDGKEVVAKKIQKRKFSKKENDDSYSDDNTYFINEVPKTLRDFNDYFGFDMTVFLLCSNVNKFLGQKSKEMREFLFGLVEDITDLDIANKFVELSSIALLLEKYTLAEITAMNKASKTKLDKELSEIDPRIDQLQKSILDVSFADEELRLSALKEQLADVELKLSDTSKSYEEVNKLKSEIAEVKGKINEIERQEKDKLSRSRQQIENAIPYLKSDIAVSVDNFERAKNSIEVKKKSIQRNTEFLAESKKQYFAVKAELLDVSSLNCPSCGQSLPSDKAEATRSNFEVTKAKRLEAVVEQGNAFNEAINDSKIDLDNLEKKLTEYEAEKINLQSQLDIKKVELEKLPSEMDLSKHGEYQIHALSLGRINFELGLAWKSTESTDTLKQSLLDSKHSITTEIETTQRLLGSADSNNRATDTIEELKLTKRTLSQSISNCECILDSINTLDRKKNELMVKEINGKFSIVKWVLYEFNKGGTYQPCCIPMVDGYLFGDTTNEGREIAAKIDICQSIQRIKGISCPIFLDRAESINDFNIPSVDCQMILLSVSDDKNLKVEGE